jgi:hypothetical protein
MEESLRMIERIIATLLGGFFSWLGYRLFLDVTLKQDSSGEFKLPSGVIINLTRVGPGVFFALFGAAIVCFSLYSRVTIDRTETRSAKPQGAIVADSERQPGGYSPSSTGEEKVRKTFTGLAEQDQATQQELPFRRNECREYIAFLNRLNTHLETRGEASELRDYKRILPQIKLAVVGAVWGKDWGSWPAFQDWVNNTGAAQKQVPQNVNKEPYEYFDAR